jgi:glycosyltransferase involved in cell wall biosynthesis
LLDPKIPIVLFADDWGGVGGTARYVVMLARNLRRRGYVVAAICHRSDAMEPIRRELSDAGVVVHLMPEGRPSQRGHIQRLQGLRQIIRGYPGCIVALMMGYYTRGGGVVVAAKLGGASAIVRADLTPPEPPHRVRAKLELRLKDMITDSIVVGAQENIDAFASSLGRDRTKMHVIHTGIELDRFVPSTGREQFRAEMGIGERELIIGMTSRLSDERKGVRDFLAMAATIAHERQDVRFLIVGDGVLRESLEADAASRSIRERVVFAGWRADIPATLAAMDLYVMPSHLEGGPTSVLEAMAMALPVVATRVGMVPEVIDDGVSGCVAPPGDPGALARLCQSLLESAVSRESLGAAARERALRDFSIDRMSERYLIEFARARRANRSA